MVHSFRNLEVSGKLDAECVKKREANAQRTQVCHSRRESLMASSARGKKKTRSDVFEPQRIESEHVFRKTPK